jgi:hypothetical protein
VDSLGDLGPEVYHHRLIALLLKAAEERQRHWRYCKAKQTYEASRNVGIIARSCDCDFTPKLVAIAKRTMLMLKPTGIPPSQKHWKGRLLA